MINIIIKGICNSILLVQRFFISFFMTSQLGDILFILELLIGTDHILLHHEFAFETTFLNLDDILN